MTWATIDDLSNLDLRVGTVVRSRPNTGARDPALCLWIDLGAEIGTVQSSAKITDHYEPEEMVGRQVVVVNGLAPMRIGGFRSDVLVVGALTDGGVVLLTPDADVPPGSSIA